MPSAVMAAVVVTAVTTGTAAVITTAAIAAAAVVMAGAMASCGGSAVFAVSVAAIYMMPVSAAFCITFPYSLQSQVRRGAVSHLT